MRRRREGRGSTKKKKEEERVVVFLKKNQPIVAIVRLFLSFLSQSIIYLYPPIGPAPPPLVITARCSCCSQSP